MHRLDRGVVVILVDLLVDGSGNLLVLLRLDGLVRHSRSNGFVDGCVVVTSLTHEVGNGGLGFLHCVLIG